MRVLVIANAESKEELLTGPINDDMQLEWITSTTNFRTDHTVDACIDLLFQNTVERNDWLNRLKASIVVINSVIIPIQEIQQDFIRINGWNTFLKRTVIEAATANQTLKAKAEELFAGFGKKTEWVPDIAGLITPRVVASIINEAFFALEENVSTREEIDIAMKLGTNYPFGPFEWSNKIGLANICSLLRELAKKQGRYKPSSLLEQTAE